MIGRLRGRVLALTPSQVVLDVGGVGYEVDIPISTHQRVQGQTDEVLLFTHLAVREDAHQLFGFATESDRNLFRELIRVKGVGPRLALTILSGMDADGLIRSIQGKDIKALTALPGVGKKTAEQLVLDLSGRLPEVAVESAPAAAAARGNLADAEAALIGLGFKPQEASVALARVEDQDADVETLIKQALKALG